MFFPPLNSLHIQRKSSKNVSHFRVDVFIPNENQVGGFSMCSAPSVMKSDSKLQLAIKYSSWPPSNWVHKRGKVGDKLAIRAGGDFFYDPPLTEKMPNLTLIAGGVGINPLLSILLHLSTKLAAGSNVENFPEHMTLLYSAKSKEEILFQVNECDNFIFLYNFALCNFVFQGYHLRLENQTEIFYCPLLCNG